MIVRYIYTIVFYLAIPLVILRLFYRALKAPAYRQRIAERFGIFPSPNFHNSIWIHSVSVGETIAAAPLVKLLQQRYPQSSIVVTTMTPTGSERVSALFGDSVFHVYIPYDLPTAISSFLQRVRPRLLIIMETELWPNTIYACSKRSIPVVLANARLSEKSAAGYQRFSLLTQSMLGALSKVVAQSQADADRFLSLGMDHRRVRVSGSIKFDISLSDNIKDQSRQLKSQWTCAGKKLVWIAASTRIGEDEIILRAFAQLAERWPDLLLLLVPRHPERFKQVAELSRQAGFNTALRSLPDSVTEQTQVIIGDTMGELLLFYGCADIAFVGGSLVDTGGHNMLEAAAWGLPIITGESNFNFAEISQLLQTNKALVTVNNSESLAEQVSVFVNSAERRSEAGDRAKVVIASNRGSLDRLLDTIGEYI
jgi:3-deoxy-D-manno-octulosonic-acid transferase